MAETGRLVGLVVTLVAAVVVIAAVAVPVLSSVTDSVYTTEENEYTGYRVTVGDASTSLSIENVDSSAATYLIDGVQTVIDFESNPLNYYLVITDSFILRITSSGLDVYGLGAGWYNLNTTGTSVTMEGGVATLYIASSGTTFTAEYTVLIIPDSEGDHVLTTSAAWLDHDATCYSIIIGRGYGTSTYWETLTATTAGETVTLMSKYYDSTATEMTDTGDLTVTVSTTGTGDLADEVYVTSVSDGEHTATTNAIIVPLSYRTLTDSQSTLLSLVDVIPLLLVLMVLLVAAYAVIRSAQE